MVIWSLCHSCRFACQQLVVKTFPGLSNLRSEDGAYIYIYIWYGIHHWRIFGSSYRKLAWAGFEDAVTVWAIRSWVQLALRANFVEPLQFHLFFQCSLFIAVFAFVSRHICFIYTNLPVIASIYVYIYMYVYIYIYIYMCIYIFMYILYSYTLYLCPWCDGIELKAG